MGDIALLADNHKNLAADTWDFPYMDPLGSAYSSLAMVAFDALTNTRKKQKQTKLFSLLKEYMTKRYKKTSKNLLLSLTESLR